MANTWHVHFPSDRVELFSECTHTITIYVGTTHTHSKTAYNIMYYNHIICVYTHTCIHCRHTIYTTHNHNHRSDQPLGGSASIIFFPSSCILGKPFAAMATSQYTLSVSTVAFFCKCSNRTYFASSSFALSMSVLTSDEITPLCFSFNRLSFGLTTSRNSSSYVSRNRKTENGEAAGNAKVKVHKCTM